MSEYIKNLPKKLRSYFSYETLRGFFPFLISIIAVIIALFFVFVFISINSDIYFPDLWIAFFNSTFGSIERFGRMLTKAMLILILTIGLSITFRSGLFNIGAVGQMVLGAVVAAGVGLYSYTNEWSHM